jgi:acylphosphatase
MRLPRSCYSVIPLVVMVEHAKKICLRSVVSGTVQGVFYRATTQRKARELGITGWARNCSDGTVEVLACGDEAAVQLLLDRLWQGSAQSSVVDITSDVIDYQPLSSFETR